MLISFPNTKGGVGKSTLACHLAVWLFDSGYRVALLDTDKQGTASEWIRNAEPGITVRVALEMDEIQKARDELLATYEFVVADVAGEEGEAANTITLLSDMAIIPLQPTKPDVRALKDGLKTIRLAHAMSGGKKPKAILVLNLVRKLNAKNAKLKEQMRGLGLRVADCDVRRLEALADSCDSAVTRDRSPKAQEASHDIEGLFAELFAGILQKRRVANG
jgi:chromosome partitioning protein